jgi:hypothetical protein
MLLRTVNPGLTGCSNGSREASQSGFGHESPKSHGLGSGGAREAWALADYQCPGSTGVPFSGDIKYQSPSGLNDQAS